MPGRMERKHLDQVALDVELVLISVVQGVALSTLAAASAPLLRAHRLEAYAFMGSGLAFVLSFWSVSLIHAISFVRWPMDLPHYLFYFALAFCECLTFWAMDHPHDWFGFSLASFLVAWALYLYDYRLILRQREERSVGESERALYQHVVRRQRYEMWVLMPAGVAFSVAAWLVVGRRPGAAAPFALAQLVFTLVFVADFLRSFAERQRRITACLGG
jgi:hypothetical protein